MKIIELKKHGKSFDFRIDEEELKLIIRDLISNRDNDDIREFNEKLYANVDYSLFFEHCTFPKNSEELNRWYNWYSCYRS